MRLELNSLGQPAERAAHRAELIAYLEQHADRRDDDARRRLHSNPLRILDTKNPAMQEVVEAAVDLVGHRMQQLDSLDHAHAAPVALERLARRGQHCAAVGVRAQRTAELQRADQRAGDDARRRARRLRQGRLDARDEAPHAHGRRLADGFRLARHVAGERRDRAADLERGQVLVGEIRLDERAKGADALGRAALEGASHCFASASSPPGSLLSPSADSGDAMTRADGNAFVKALMPPM